MLFYKWKNISYPFDNNYQTPILVWRTTKLSLGMEHFFIQMWVYLIFIVTDTQFTSQEASSRVSDTCSRGSCRCWICYGLVWNYLYGRRELYVCGRTVICEIYGIYISNKIVNHYQWNIKPNFRVPDNNAQIGRSITLEQLDENQINYLMLPSNS